MRKKIPAGLLVLYAGTVLGADPLPQDLVKGNTQFALDLYAKLGVGAGNVFFSPYSLSAALAMTSAGARGETLTEINTVFHFPPVGPHAGFHRLDGALGGTDRPYELNIANRIWLRKGAAFQPEFLKTLADDYGAGAELLDFGQAPEPSRLTINHWVSDRTKTKIPELLPEGTIDSITQTVLTNAVYFKGTWEKAFEKTDTQPTPFHGSDGTTFPVDLMRQTSRFPYAEDEWVQALEMPYRGGDLSLVVLLPKEGKTLGDVEKRLNPGQLETWVAGLQNHEVEVFFPKFTSRFRRNLPPDLKSLGIRRAFDPDRADFSGVRPLRPDEPIFISHVFHEAFLQVDEEGTEATAATAVVMGVGAAAPSSLLFELTVHSFILSATALRERFFSWGASWGRGEALETENQNPDTSPCPSLRRRGRKGKDRMSPPNRRQFFSSVVDTPPAFW
ncbi:MAG: serpin family protein [Elusimicrobia bacterium]|nr:serpin family protein [Elusimicrobiota bacterium]